MNVNKIYQKYNIPPNLQKHMLRVAALSRILIDNWNGNEIDKKSVVLACLFHDMANIIKFKFDKPLLFEEEQNNIDFWNNIRKQYVSKYGENVHKATLTICQEIGLNKKVLDLINNLDWDNTIKVLENKDNGSAVCIYCDMRIGPHGILSLKDRIDNLQTRNKNHDMTFIRYAAVLLEKTLQKYLLTDIESITDLQLNKRIKELLTVDV